MSVSTINVSLKGQNNCFSLLPSRTLHLPLVMNLLNLLSVEVGITVSFMLSKSLSNEKEAPHFLSTFALLHDVLSLVCINEERRKDM